MEVLVRSYIILAVLIIILMLLVAFIIRSKKREKLTANITDEIPANFGQSLNEQ